MIKYLLIAIGALLQICFIASEHKEEYVRAVVLKGLASLMFVITGFLAWKNTGNGFARLIFIGLALGIAAAFKSLWSLTKEGHNAGD